MATMKSVRTGGVGKVEVVDVERPVPGPKDALRTDPRLRHLRHRHHLPPHGRHAHRRRRARCVPVPLGHEPAGEIVEVGAEVTGLKVGDRVVVNPQDAPSGIIGCGGERTAA